MSVVFGMLAGCIVPVPLEREPTQPDSPPEIIYSSANPPAGTTQEHQVTDTFEFTFPVDDADLDDILEGRLFRGDNGVKLEEQTLPGDEPSNPSRRTAKFDAQYCGITGLSGGATIQLFAVVADRPFTDQTSEATSGAEAFIAWTLKCD